MGDSALSLSIVVSHGFSAVRRRHAAGSQAPGRCLLCILSVPCPGPADGDGNACLSLLGSGHTVGRDGLLRYLSGSVGQRWRAGAPGGGEADDGACAVFPPAYAAPGAGGAAPGAMKRKSCLETTIEKARLESGLFGRRIRLRLFSASGAMLRSPTGPDRAGQRLPARGHCYRFRRRRH